MPPGVHNEGHQEQDRNMTAQEPDYTKTDTQQQTRQEQIKHRDKEGREGGKEGSHASASREAQHVQGGTAGLSQGGSRSPGILAGSQGGAGGTDHGGSGRTGTLEDPAEQEPWRMAMAGRTREDPPNRNPGGWPGRGRRDRPGRL